jgi:hypothetical protein
LIAHAHSWWIVVAVVGSPIALQLAYAAVTLLLVSKEAYSRTANGNRREAASLIRTFS